MNWVKVKTATEDGVVMEVRSADGKLLIRLWSISAQEQRANWKWVVVAGERLRTGIDETASAAAIAAEGAYALTL
ncbi:hypothetical protein EYW49_11605 [Siculibacillus lacustris]|uniref:Uncharacterized protein n=1 Tax=Siculibacillus lacustris TaxID=1549641 RepID=A0A4Q9VQX7_9HYPH|nr:hypothetical protein [Siculibacillus lacustris]TBW37394.1 hypothetical protein EYW49_11605 [Siculibacillus lacustris]